MKTLLRDYRYWMNIYLVGYRCTGKTTVGRELSARLGIPFADCDTLLESRAKMSVSEFVTAKGWDAFRELERSVLSEIAKSTGQVVSCGGGVVLDPANIELMRSAGVVFWLDATVGDICARMEKDLKTKDLRPSLTGLSPMDEVAAVYGKRRPLYETASHYRIDSGSLEPDEVCSRIIDYLRRNHGRQFFRAGIQDNDLW